MKYRISDLSNFSSLASCRTISEGAIKLGISQPALTESLKRLEKDSGQILFYRSRNGVQLTPSGHIFLSKTQKAIAGLKTLEEDEEGGDIFGARILRIGCHATVAQYSLPKAILWLSQRAPDYKIELKHDLSRNIQLQVQRGQIDIGIVINPVRVPDLVIKKVESDLVGVWSSIDRKKAQTETLICNTQLFQTQHILRKWKEKPKRLIETESLELICQMAAQGVGYGILPSRAVSLSQEKLKMEKNLPTYVDEIALVHRPEFGSSKAEVLLKEALLQSLN